MGGISPWRGIEQILEDGIGSSAYSQSKQYLIGERFVPLTQTYSSNQTSVLIKKIEKNMSAHQIEVVRFSIDQTKAFIESIKQSDFSSYYPKTWLNQKWP